MPDRDWEKELAEIDRRISSTPDEAPATDTAPARVTAKAGTPAPRAAAPASAVAPALPRRHWKATAGLLVRVLLTALLLAGVVVWPYETRCGAWLAGYLATIAVTGLAALWSAVAAWRHRAALVHVVSLAMLVAATVYGAIEVLPRVGYAMPDPTHPAMWACR